MWGCWLVRLRSINQTPEHGTETPRRGRAGAWELNLSPFECVPPRSWDSGIILVAGGVCVCSVLHLSGGLTTWRRRPFDASARAGAPPLDLSTPTPLELCRIFVRAALILVPLSPIQPLNPPARGQAAAAGRVQGSRGLSLALPPAWNAVLDRAPLLAKGGTCLPKP